MQFSKPLEISSQKDLLNLQNNQKVFIQGNVIDDKIYSSSRILFLDNNITLYCDCPALPRLKDKNISAIGIIDTFQKTKIKVLKIAF